MHPSLMSAVRLNRAVVIRNPRRPMVVMVSEEYGLEEFEYDSIQEARDGMSRLAKSVRGQGDYVQRTLYLVVDQIEF